MTPAAATIAEIEVTSKSICIPRRQHLLQLVLKITSSTVNTLLDEKRLNNSSIS
jgi:hypothetical protein